MQPTMVIMVQIPAGGSGLRPVKVSLPLVAELVREHPEKYRLPENMPKPQATIPQQPR
jgi:hypothetical protein